MSRERRGNDRLCCEAIRWILEKRTGATAGSIRVGGRRAEIDLQFNIHEQPYAVDHTLIDPYEDRTFDDVRLKQVLEPMVCRLNADKALPADGRYVLLVEAGVLTAVKDRYIPSIQERIRAWIVKIAPSIPRPANPALMQYVTATLEGVPFRVALQRWSESGGSLCVMRWVPRDREARRGSRIHRTLKQKALQLASYKRSGAITILVLEHDDIALTNATVVGQAVQMELPLAVEHLPPPDEIYLAETVIEPWTVYTLKRSNLKWPSAVVCPPEYHEFRREELAECVSAT